MTEQVSDGAQTAPSDWLGSPPEDLAARVRLLEAVETELRERLGRLDQR